MQNSHPYDETTDLSIVSTSIASRTSVSKTAAYGAIPRRSSSLNPISIPGLTLSALQNQSLSNSYLVPVAETSLATANSALSSSTYLSNSESTGSQAGTSNTTYPTNQYSGSLSYPSTGEPTDNIVSWRGNKEDGAANIYPSMQSSSSHNGPRGQGHVRNRSSKGGNESDKQRNSKQPSQKSMLSRALQKANTAVQLDNAQNLEGARQAYSEACELLEHVLARTTAEDDQRKLEAIRQTYASRIDELDQIEFWPHETAKALPARPENDEIDDPTARSHQSRAIRQRDSNNVIGGNAGSSARYDYDQQHAHSNVRSQEWGSEDSNTTMLDSSQQTDPRFLQSSFSRQSMRARPTEGDVPAPLTSIKPSTSATRVNSVTSSTINPNKHIRDLSQNSWLDGIGESGESTNSSIQSRSSSLAYRREHFRAHSVNTENEFDNALDAAIEAAYDDGYEPMSGDEYERKENDDVVAKVLRKVEIARERVRQTEREAFGLATDHELRRQPSMDTQAQPYSSMTSGGFYDDNSSDEGERMLEEMALDYNIEDFTLRNQQNGGLRPPRQDSMSFMSRSIPSSNQAPSDPPPSLSLLQTTQLHSNMGKGITPAVPPPQQSLPELPVQIRSTSPLQSVRSRRLSGQNPKQLKIETTKLGQSFVTHDNDYDNTTKEKRQDQQQDRSDSTSQPKISPTSETVSPDARNTNLQRNQTQYGDLAPNQPKSPSSKQQLRKNFSSSSLRSLKTKNIGTSNFEDASDLSPSTCNHHGTMRIPNLPTVPTPMSSDFKDHGEVFSAAIHPFDDSLRPPTTPRSPQETSLDAPFPLEPCPTDFLLRPFWLMRCLFQTLVHPRGGYVSTKLFVPRDAWRVKGVKLKNVDDKIANCDLLTAALLKLAQVDTCDADAVLEEMQALEGILEQVQLALTRKLGNEVGVQGSGALFKDAAAAGEGEVPASSMPRSGSVSTKSSSFSWRRLRSKNSAVNLGAAPNSRSAAIQETPRDNVTIATLPMTPQPTSRPARRDLSLAQFLGPNAVYMSSLARLFDAAQAVDQIARQVDDPGLRHADKTQVGLELCTRHAAEFFGFYICRFALTDMGLLLDKYLKRGSEWVLA